MNKIGGKHLLSTDCVPL